MYTAELILTPHDARLEISNERAIDVLYKTSFGMVETIYGKSTGYKVCVVLEEQFISEKMTQLQYLNDCEDVDLTYYGFEQTIHIKGKLASIDRSYLYLEYCEVNILEDNKKVMLRVLENRKIGKKTMLTATDEELIEYLIEQIHGRGMQLSVEGLNIEPETLQLYGSDEKNYRNTLENYYQDNMPVIFELCVIRGNMFMRDIFLNMNMRKDVKNERKLLNEKI